MRALSTFIFSCFIFLAGCQPEVVFQSKQLVDRPRDRARLSWDISSSRITEAPIIRVRIEPDIGEVSSQGEVMVSPSETTVYTLIAEAELKGRSWQGRYTVTVYVGPRLKDVVFDDANFQACVLDSGNTHVEELTFLNCVQRDIYDLGGIESLQRLAILNIDQNYINDLAPITQLPRLHTLNIGDNLISDLSPLSGNQSISTLSMYGNEIGDVQPLSGMTQLRVLALDDNNILDAGPLQSLIDLGVLTLSRNQIEDVSPLANLNSLLVLDLFNNQVNSGVLSLRALENTNLIRMEGNGDVACLTYLRLLAQVPVSFNQCSVF